MLFSISHLVAFLATAASVVDAAALNTTTTSSTTTISATELAVLDHSLALIKESFEKETAELELALGPPSQHGSEKFPYPEELVSAQQYPEKAIQTHQSLIIVCIVTD